jgi:hypothetical protein
MSMTLFAQNSLRAVQDLVVKQDFPERMMANGSLVPISSELPAWAKTYQYSLYTSLGSAKIMSSGSDDFPEVSAYMESRYGVIRTIGNQYSYSWEDMQYAQQGNVSLDSTLALTAREIIEQTVDNTAWKGSAEFNLLGFLGHANVPTYSVANDGTSSSTTWASKTAAQIYRDLSEFARKSYTDSKGAFFSEVILMDDVNYALISETPYPASTATETILSFYLKTQATNPFGVKRIIPVPYLRGAGTSSTSLMVGYMPRTDKIRFHMPMGFMQMPTEYQSRKYTTPCIARCGGVQLLKVLSMVYADGV